MKTAVLCISDTYAKRGEKLMDLYREKGDEVLLLEPDFSHTKKEKISSAPAGIKLIPHRAYKRNLSFSRLYGHLEFAKKCRRFLEEWKPDRIHCLIPANSFAKEMAEYKKANPEVQLIFDVNDLWPESLPLPVKDSWFPFSLWKNLRDSSLNGADLVFYECGFFEKRLQDKAPGKGQVLYWSKQGEQKAPDFINAPDALHIAYIGSMNNILDIELMRQFLDALSKEEKTVLHLIGGGEKKQQLLDAIPETVEVIDHGHIYEEEKKRDIFAKCRFGLNLMKSSVQVGLSMKSLDYLEAGLPIVNTVGGDLHEWVIRDQIGFNLTKQNAGECAKQIAGQSDAAHLQMRKAARAVFEARLSDAAFFKQFEKGLQKLSENKTRPKKEQVHA
jgi:glycosyltransferase involved in cell wall biosynthesis